MANNRHGATVKRGDGAHDGRIVGAGTVATLLEYVFKKRIHVLFHARTLRYTGKRHTLRSGKIRIIFESHARHLQNREA